MWPARLETDEHSYFRKSQLLASMELFMLTYSCNNILPVWIGNKWMYFWHDYQDTEKDFTQLYFMAVSFYFKYQPKDYVIRKYWISWGSAKGE